MLTDKFKKNADALRHKKLFLLDMDGTIYNENSIFEGTLDFLSQIEKNGGRYIFITNNSSKSVKDYVEKVNRMGITADASHFYTSSQATAFYLQENYPGQTVFSCRRAGAKRHPRCHEAGGFRLCRFNRL